MPSPQVHCAILLLLLLLVAAVHKHSFQFESITSALSVSSTNSPLPPPLGKATAPAPMNLNTRLHGFDGRSGESSAFFWIPKRLEMQPMQLLSPNISPTCPTLVNEHPWSVAGRAPCRAPAPIMAVRGMRSSHAARMRRERGDWGEQRSERRRSERASEEGKLGNLIFTQRSLSLLPS